MQSNLQHSFVFDDNNIRVPGYYQHLSVNEETMFRRIDKDVAAAARASCGTMLEVGGRNGSGKVSLLMAPYAFGPFQGQ